MTSKSKIYFEHIPMASDQSLELEERQLATSDRIAKD